MMYLGDYAEDATLHFKWNSFDSSGASITRSTNGTIYVYLDDATGTEVTTGITDTEDFDSLTGIHHCKIDLSSAAFYAVGGDYTVVLKTATIDGQTVNAVLAHFSIENRFDEVDVTKIGGAAQSATDLKDFADAGYDPATKKVQGVVLVDTTTTNTDVRGTDSAALASVCTNTRLAELDAANLPADVDAILADTNELQSDDVPGLISALNDPTAASIADAVLDEALSGHVVAGSLGKAVADTEADATAILADTNELQSDDVPGLIAALNDPTAASIADAVLDEALSGHVVAGSLGKAVSDIEADTNELQTDDVPGLISGLNDPTAASVADAVLDEALSGHTGAGSLGKAVADIEADATAILADTNELQGDDVPGLIAALNDPTAASIADAVLDEDLSGHVVAGSLGKAVSDIEADATAILAETNELQSDDVPGLIAALNDPTALSIADAVLDEVVAGHVIAGSLGRVVSDIETDTDELQTDDVPGLIAALNDPTAAAVADAVLDEALSGHVVAGSLGMAVADTEADVTAILADTNELQSDDVPGLIAALNDPSAASVADAVLDEALSGHVVAGSLGKAVADTEADATTLEARASEARLAELDAGNLPADVDAIQADTDELQTDWADGGRLDLTLDARASQTTADAVETDTQDIQSKIGTPSADLAADIAAAQTDITAIQADLPLRLTKNVAFTNFMFKMVDASDGYTAEVGISVTAVRSLDGAAFAACANSASEVSDGWYKIDLDAADTNGNSVVLKFTGTGCRATEYVVITQAS